MISQARVLEWVAISFSSPQSNALKMTRTQTHASLGDSHTDNTGAPTHRYAPETHPDTPRRAYTCAHTGEGVRHTLSYTQPPSQLHTCTQSVCTRKHRFAHAYTPRSMADTLSSVDSQHAGPEQQLSHTQTPTAHSLKLALPQVFTRCFIPLQGAKEIKPDLSTGEFI